MPRKVVTAFVHLTEGGSRVALRPGDEVPAHLADRVTNPSAFVFVDDASPDRADAQPAVFSPAYDPDDIASLRAAAKARGLPAGGSKKDLAARIAAHDA